MSKGSPRSTCAWNACKRALSGGLPRQEAHTKAKQPYAFSLEDNAPFAFAGLWDAWKEPDGDWLQSVSIVTTEANELMESVHNRMPMILHPKDYGRWLERKESTKPSVDLLRPNVSDEMKALPCNPLVGNVRNSGPEMPNNE